MGCINRLNLCPASGDTENVLLQKILQSLNEGGGGVSSLSINGGEPLTGDLALSVVTGFSIDGGPLQTGNVFFSNVAGPYVLKAGDTMTGPLVITPSAANATPLTLNNSLTGASLVPTLAINPTWNTTGAPTALLVNATDTASSSASLLFNFQLSSVNVLNLRKDGRLTLAGRFSGTDISGVGNILASLNATTSSTPTALILQHNLSAGTPVAGFGVVLDWNLDSTTTASTLAARLITQWTDPAHATRSSQQVFQQMVSGVFTTSLSLTGTQALFRDGTEAAPALAFAADPDTGIYRVGANTIGFSTDGVLRATIVGDPLGGQVQAGVSGGGSVPTFVAFAGLGVLDTGMYFPSAAEIGFAVSGTNVVQITGSEVVINITLLLGQPLIVPEGDVTTPGLGVGEASTGLSNSGGNHLSFSVASVLNFDLTQTDLLMALGVRFGVRAGADQRAGDATLVAGTVTVANTTVTANTIVLLTRRTSGGTIGTAVTYTVTDATDFTINSDNILDTSTFSYFLIEVTP